MRERDEPDGATEAGDDALARLAGDKARRKLAARRHGGGVWAGLGKMGLVGWAVVLPTLAGTALGLWLDHHYPGPHGWTLALLVAGLVAGCFNAWRWVAREDRAMRKDREDDDAA